MVQTHVHMLDFLFLWAIISVKNNNFAVGLEVMLVSSS